MIPEAAVEAAAEAIVVMRQNGQENTQQEYARAALEAAAPHMLAEAKADAWDEGHESGFWNGRLSQLTAPYDAPTPDIGADHAKATNPYRSQA